jgi:hypothetical protein
MMAMVTHPVVGTWDMTVDIGGETFPFLAFFHADGTYMEVYPWGAIISGVWKPTGERTAQGTAVSYEFIDDRLSRGEDRFTAQVDETGNAIEEDFTYVSRFQDDGSLSGESLEGRTPGTRLEVLPVVSLAELVPGGTPVMPEDLADEATPAP